MKEAKPSSSADPAYARPPSELEKAIGKRFDKERIPRIDLKMLFGPHGSEEDAQRWKAEIADADIIFLEGPGFGIPELEALINKFANGEDDPNNYFARDAAIPEGMSTGSIKFTNEIYRVLSETSGTKRRVVRYLDLPPSDAGVEQHHVAILRAVQGSMHEAVREQSSFEESVRRYEGYVDMQAKEILKERDAYAVKALAPTIVQSLKSEPDLRKRKPIRVRIIYGSAHSGMYHLIKGGKKPLHAHATRTLEKPFVFDREAELIRKKAWGMPVAPEEIERSFAELFIVDFTHFTYRNVEAFNQVRDDVSFVRALVDSYTDAEARTLYGLILAGPDKQEKAQEFAYTKARPVLEKLYAQG